MPTLHTESLPEELRLLAESLFQACHVLPLPPKPSESEEGPQFFEWKVMLYDTTKSFCNFLRKQEEISSSAVILQLILDLLLPTLCENYILLQEGMGNIPGPKMGQKEANKRDNVSPRLCALIGSRDIEAVCNNLQSCTQVLMVVLEIILSLNGKNPTPSNDFDKCVASIRTVLSFTIFSTIL